MIDLDHHLPPRATRLDAAALTNVFGGCAYLNAACGRWGQCCPGFVCRTVVLNPWLTKEQCATS
jgi:hypothetical protein